MRYSNINGGKMMDFWLSFWVGVIIWCLCLFDKRIGIIAGIVGFIPFWIAAATGLIGVTVDPSTTNNATSNIMNQGTKMIFDQIVGTYLVGLIMGAILSMVKEVVATISHIF
jgi:hypothetical protein